MNEDILFSKTKVNFDKFQEEINQLKWINIYPDEYNKKQERSISYSEKCISRW